MSTSVRQSLVPATQSLFPVVPFLGNGLRQKIERVVLPMLLMALFLPDVYSTKEHTYEEIPLECVLTPKRLVSLGAFCLLFLIVCLLPCGYRGDPPATGPRHYT